MRDAVWAIMESEPVISLLEPTVLEEGFGPMQLDVLSGKMATDSQEVLKDLRSLELNAQMRWTQAILRSETAHFELPAGTHADVFVRVADTFAEIPYVDRLADWIQDRLTADTAIIGDTWTLLPLLRELKHRAQLEFGWHLPLETFPAYPQTAQIGRILERTQAQITEAAQPKVMFLLTVASSRFLLENMRRYAGQILGPDVSHEVVTLVETHSPGSQRIADRLDAFSHVKVERFNVPAREICKLCQDAERSALVRIDRTKYRPIVRGALSARMLRADYASRHSGLWEAASRTDAVRLHTYTDQRHLEIHFDVGRLLADDRFRRNALHNLRQAAPLCDLVITPRHSETSSLVDLAKRAYSSSTRILQVSREASTKDPEGRAALQKVIAEHQPEHILILDDAVIHGHTIRALHRLVQRTLTEVGYEPYEVHGFVVLARPSTEQRWKRLQDAFLQKMGRMHLQAAYELWVPDRNPCPWCTERQAIEGLRATLQDAERRDRLLAAVGITQEELESTLALIDERIEVLRGPEGILSSVFCCRSDGTAAFSDEPDLLSPHSLFGDRLQEAVAYAAVSTAMQEIRSAPTTDRTGFVWDVPRVLTAYHDPLISAAFLRGASPSETVDVDSSQAFRHALTEISFSSSQGDPVFDQDPSLAAELHWASVMGILPMSYRGVVRTRVEPILRQCPDPVLAYLDCLDWDVHGGDAVAAKS